jgi:C_GCAxxG_C_C family probable redox protein
MQRNDKELIDKAYQLGFDYQKSYIGCCQCTIAAIQDTLDIRDDSVFKAGTGFAGGVGVTAIGLCGGYSGGVMVLSQLLGRERSNFEDPEGIRFKTLELTRKLMERYLQEFGSIICRDIHTLIFGRPYYMADPDDFEKLKAAGAIEQKCPDVVGRATKLAVELVLEEGLVKPPKK